MLLKRRTHKKRAEQGDRLIGLAHSQFDKVYSYNEYDLEVNTEVLNPSECAEKILGFIKSDQDYSVFKNLNKKEISVS